jgi:exodeoxyribonuclease VII large subunit
MVDDLGARATHAFNNRITGAADRLQNAGSLLQSYSYQGTLARGFALIRDERGRPVTSTAEAVEATRIDIEFADGRTPAIIATDASPPASAKPKRKTGKPASSDGGQGQLL